MSNEVNDDKIAAEAAQAARDRELPKELDGIMSPLQFRIGYDNDKDPQVMVFNVPLQRLAEDLEEGSALLRGKLDEAKQIALNLIKMKRERKKMQGLVRPPIGGNGLKLHN